jgi:NAD+ diphosphatase
MNDYLQFCLEHELFSQPPHDKSTSCRPLWFIFQGDKLAVQAAEPGAFTLIHLSPEQLGLQPARTVFLGRHRNNNCFLAETTEETSLPAHISMVPLRSLLGKISRDHFTIAGRGLQILNFHAGHKFCGRCGTPTEARTAELALTCPECGHTSFPPVSPAVIMSVARGDAILLGRAPHFPGAMYSTLAGFVEPGETLEEAVKREVFEEVGIRVGAIDYVASQPWPFPHSMMIGFSTEYRSGEIRIDDHELEDARWFNAEDLPALPRKGTIARHLIDKFLTRWR